MKWADLNDTPLRYAVSYLLYAEKGAVATAHSFLVVQRPADDANLPNVWGLPAGMVPAAAADGVPTDAEWVAAVRLSGVQKLGTTLVVGALLGENFQKRSDYTLQMRQYAVTRAAGAAAPVVPQSVAGVTQYQQLRYRVASDLCDAAVKGSLCSRMYIDFCGSIAAVKTAAAVQRKTKTVTAAAAAAAATAIEATKQSKAAAAKKAPTTAKAGKKPAAKKAATKK
jgi:hypothetical protein